jgi:hypothetical protein
VIDGFSMRIVLVGALSAAALCLEAQPAVVSRVKHTVACRTCRVEFTRLATLGSRGDSALPSQFSIPERDSQGRFYMFSDQSQVLIYDSTGHLVRFFGRQGGGPGEFSGLPRSFGGVSRGTISRVMIGRGDTLMVIHHPSISVFAPFPRLTHVRTVRMPAGSQPLRSFTMADGTVLVGGAVLNPECRRPRSAHCR